MSWTKREVINENMETVDKCPNCNHYFLLTLIEQTPGFRSKEEEKCPYCGHVIATSMEYEFLTEKAD